MVSLLFVLHPSAVHPSERGYEPARFVEDLTTELRDRVSVASVSKGATEVDEANHDGHMPHQDPQTREACCTLIRNTECKSNLRHAFEKCRKTRFHVCVREWQTLEPANYHDDRGTSEDDHQCDRILAIPKSAVCDRNHSVGEDEHHPHRVDRHTLSLDLSVLYRRRALEGRDAENKKDQSEECMAEEKREPHSLDRFQHPDRLTDGEHECKEDLEPEEQAGHAEALLHL